MKLVYAAASPYARKCMAVAIECGLADRIETVGPEIKDPMFGNNPLSPLGKLPTLQTDDGQLLFDSSVITEYLDSLHDGAKLYPADPAKRFRALTLMALGNGIADSAFLIVHEGRINGERSPKWGERNWNGIRTATQALEDDISQLDGNLHIGHFAIGCALGYLDLRHAERNWREGRPDLAAWFAGFAARPAMEQTTPAP